MDDAALAILIGVAGALWGSYGFWAFKRGRLRAMAQWYFDDDQPDFVRNLPFCLVPLAIVSVASVLLIALGDVAAVWADVIVGISSWVLIAGLVAGVVFMVRPPRFLKPDWLVERENIRRERRQSIERERRATE